MFTLRFVEIAVFFELAAFFVLELLFVLADFFELEDFFFAAFFGAAALRDGDFARDADFFDVFFVDLPVALREAVFFAVTFFRDAFFAAGLRAVFFADRAADFRATVFFDDFLRAAVLLLDAGFAFDFWGLTFRLLPVVFLRAAALRGAAFFLLVPALLRFLLAAFFAGIRTPAGPEKNAELYIACPNMEAQKTGVLPPRGGTRRRAGKRVRNRSPASPNSRLQRAAAEAGGASLSPTGDIVLSAELL